MEKLTRPTFSPEFILEALQFVVMRISGAFGHYVGVSCKQLQRLCFSQVLQLLIVVDQAVYKYSPLPYHYSPHGHQFCCVVGASNNVLGYMSHLQFYRVGRVFEFILHGTSSMPKSHVCYRGCITALSISSFEAPEVIPTNTARRARSNDVITWQLRANYAPAFRPNQPESPIQ